MSRAQAERSAERESAPAERAVDAEAFKAALRRLPEPVAIITTSHKGRRHGMTATAFAAVSVDPPQVLVCINQRAVSWSLIRESRRFAANFLPAARTDLAGEFSQTADNKDYRFAAPAWRATESNVPILADAVAALECTVESHQQSGTHYILVGRVVALIAGGDADALLYRAGRFGRFAEA